MAISGPSTISRDTVYLNKAGAYTFTATGYSLPISGTAKSGSCEQGAQNTYYTYDNLRYTWTFSDGNMSSLLDPGGASVSHTFNGLTQGAENTIKVSLSVSCRRYRYTQSAEVDDPGQQYVAPSYDEEGNMTSPGQPYRAPTYKWSSATLRETDTSYSIWNDTSWSKAVYTRPGSFSFGCQQGHTIQSSAAGGLSAAKVGEWSIHCGKYLSWYNQANKYGNSGTYAGGATSGGLITAAWYNKLAGYCGLATRVSGGHDGTVITAELINKLGTAISKGD